jgi:hypothetical protein
MRRTCFEQAGMFDESMRSHEDVDLWLRICQKRKVVLVPKPLTHRRQGLANMTSDSDLRTRYGVIFFEKALKLPDLTEAQRDTIVQRLADAYFLRGSYLFAKGKMEECRKALRLSLQSKGSSLKAWAYYAGSFLPATLIDHLRNGKRSAQSVVGGRQNGDAA